MFNVIDLGGLFGSGGGAALASRGFSYNLERAAGTVSGPGRVTSLTWVQGVSPLTVHGFPTVLTPSAIVGASIAAQAASPASPMSWGLSNFNAYPYGGFDFRDEWGRLATDTGRDQSGLLHSLTVYGSFTGIVYLVDLLGVVDMSGSPTDILPPLTLPTGTISSLYSRAWSRGSKSVYHMYKPATTDGSNNYFQALDDTGMDWEFYMSEGGMRDYSGDSDVVYPNGDRGRYSPAVNRWFGSDTAVQSAVYTDSISSMGASGPWVLQQDLSASSPSHPQGHGREIVKVGFPNGYPASAELWVFDLIAALPTAPNAYQATTVGIPTGQVERIGRGANLGLLFECQDNNTTTISLSGSLKLII